MHQNQNYEKKKISLKLQTQNEKISFENGIGEDNVNNVVVSRNYADYSTVVAQHSDHVIVASAASSKFICKQKTIATERETNVTPEYMLFD